MKRLCILLLVLCGLVALWPSPAWSANRYVSDATGNDGNASNCATLTNRTTPAKTIAAGLGCASSGDTVILLNGTYVNQFMRSNIPGGVTVKAENPLGATILATNTCSNIFMIEVSNPNVTIDGLVTDATQATCDLTEHIRLLDNATNLTILNMEIRGGHNTEAASTSHGIAFAGSGGLQSVNRGFIVRNTKIHDIGMDTSSASGTQSYCIYAASSGILFENNECYRVGGYGVHMYCTESGGCNNNIFRNNYFHDTNDGILFASHGDNNLFYNNLVIHTGLGRHQPGIEIGGYGGGVANSNKVFNNTLYNNRSTCIALSHAGGALVTNTVVQNNICRLNDSDTVALGNSTGQTVTNNLLGTDPQFVTDPPTQPAHFQLQATSPARNAGTNAGLIATTVTTDYFGNVRPQPTGGAWDIGAAEYTTVAPPGNPSLWWKFDEGAGATAGDSSTNNHPGTLINSPTWSAGRIGAKSLTFDGISQYVTSTSVTWSAGQAVTVLFWIKTPGGTPAGTFGVDTQPSPNRFGAHVPWSDNILYWDYGTCCAGGTGRLTVDFTPYLNTWTQVALVSDGVGFQGIYLNGVLRASSGTASAPTSLLTGLEVGRRQTGTIDYATGQLDNFRLENRAWSAAEILAEYQLSARLPRHGGNLGLR